MKSLQRTPSVFDQNSDELSTYLYDDRPNSFFNIDVSENRASDFFSSSNKDTFAHLVLLQNERFYNSRISYLESLKNLGDDWISGDSIGPSEVALKKASGVLRNIVKFYSRRKKVIPKILFSPIPSGGMSIEIHFKDCSYILIKIDNDGQIEIEGEIDGKYIELDNIDVAVLSG